MDVIKNFIESANNLLGLSIPVILFIYSLNFFFFYFLGLNKLYLKLNVVFILISVFIIFMFGNIRSDVVVINTKEDIVKSSKINDFSIKDNESSYNYCYF